MMPSSLVQGYIQLIEIHVNSAKRLIILDPVINLALIRTCWDSGQIFSNLMIKQKTVKLQSNLYFRFSNQFV